MLWTHWFTMSKVGKSPYWRHDDVIKNTNNFFASFSDPHCFGAILRLEATRLEEMVATSMKDNHLSFQEIYRKSQLSSSFFEKIGWAIEVECFLQNLTKNHKICAKLSLRLWGHLWSCGAQKCLPIMCIDIVLLSCSNQSPLALRATASQSTRKHLVRWTFKDKLE
jgi:hypothetical protein